MDEWKNKSLTEHILATVPCRTDEFIHQELQ